MCFGSVRKGRFYGILRGRWKNLMDRFCLSKHLKKRWTQQILTECLSNTIKVQEALLETAYMVEETASMQMESARQLENDIEDLETSFLGGFLWRVSATEMISMMSAVVHDVFSYTRRNGERFKRRWSTVHTTFARRNRSVVSSWYCL